ncbi:FtsK/SpoIIIE domain-containing protein [Priestia flexa]|uniref:FtsK/SpoIIIE domain-containing protein n=1 Tax=Priestia flexa TaxID=86664 RepID=UPI0013D25468|nr:FtsK/SpoIIIE domain-containing protein [Priestia flexa]
MMKKLYRKYIYKARLKNAFIVADIVLTFKKGDTTIKRYPSIAAAYEQKDYLEYVFYLPQGLNPKALLDKEYIFSQTFGHSYDLTGSGLKYSLKVFTKQADSIKVYSNEEIEACLKGGLPIVAGYDHFNKLISYNMVTDPHLLIAGETGSGKSVMLRVILTTLLIHKRHMIEFYLADMKRTEFHLFRNCEGVQQVITDKKKLKKAVLAIHKELERRGDLLDEHGLEHIDEYNKLKGIEKKKYILLCIDEVALLRKEAVIMDKIEDISTQGRALGIFLILSMQRPDAKILDGQLKSNLTVRYAFRHADLINSNITLGSGNNVDASKINKAEKGKFYMRHEVIKQLQAPYLSLEHAKELLEPIKQVPIDLPPEPMFEAEITDFSIPGEDHE